MFLEIINNNGTKYIRVSETVRVTDYDSHKSVPRKKTVKNIGPVSRFDDGKTGFKVQCLPPAQAVFEGRGSAEHTVSRSASHLCHARHAERS